MSRGGEWRVQPDCQSLFVFAGSRKATAAKTVLVMCLSVFSHTVQAL